MSYVTRSIESKLRAYAGAFPCTLVSGARQVGKSTVLARIFGETHRNFVFDPVQDLYGVREDPDLFLRNNPPPLILDEIQYVPELVPALKRAIDRDRTPGHYLITGSQHWEVMRKLSESLAGRVGILELSGYSLCEQMGQKEDWLHIWLENVPDGLKSVLQYLQGCQSAKLSPTRQIWRGGYPEVQTLDKQVVPGWMQGYTTTYLQRDVRSMIEVRDESQFSTFLSLCAALTAQECNYNQLGREIDITPPTAKRWLGFLRGSYQWIEIPAFSDNQIKKLSTRSKGYLSDTGLACYLLKISSDQAVQGHPAFGRLFETLVVTDVVKRLQSLPLIPQLYHYRQHSGTEVDLLIKKDGKLFPIEIKASSRARPTDARGIQVLKEKVGSRVQPGLIIYAGTELLQLNDQTLAIPYDLIFPSKGP